MVNNVFHYKFFISPVINQEIIYVDVLTQYATGARTPIGGNHRVFSTLQRGVGHNIVVSGLRLNYGRPNYHIIKLIFFTKGKVANFLKNALFLNHILLMKIKKLAIVFFLFLIETCFSLAAICIPPKMCTYRHVTTHNPL